jgi:hypothetical protein
MHKILIVFILMLSTSLFAKIDLPIKCRYVAPDGDKIVVIIEKAEQILFNANIYNRGKLDSSYFCSLGEDADKGSAKFNCLNEDKDDEQELYFSVNPEEDKSSLSRGSLTIKGSCY